MPSLSCLIFLVFESIPLQIHVSLLLAPFFSEQKANEKKRVILNYPRLVHRHHSLS